MPATTLDTRICPPAGLRTQPGSEIGDISNSRVVAISQKIDDGREAGIIKLVYQEIAENAFFGGLPERLQHGFSSYFHGWQPLPVDEIPKIVSQFRLLRAISNFYARSATINIAEDAIQMPLNCDGSHMVSARAYERFVEENL